MTQKTIHCKPFPQIDTGDLSPRSTLTEKLACCAEFIELAPETLRSLIKERINTLKPYDLDSSLQKCIQASEQYCSHFAIVAFAAPPLLKSYLNAFKKCPTQFHEVIEGTFQYFRDDETFEDRKTNLTKFLNDVHDKGIESATIQALEEPYLRLFGTSRKPCSNQEPYAKSMQELLNKIIFDSSQERRSRMTAVKWLPSFTSNIGECVEAVERILQVEDYRLRGVAITVLADCQPDRDDLVEIVSRHLLEEPVTMVDSFYLDSMETDYFPGAVPAKLASRKYSEQEIVEIFGRQIEKWNALFECTDPADRGAVESNIKLLYEAAGADPPLAVLWFDNPRTAAIALSIWRCILEDQLLKSKSGVLRSKIINYLERNHSLFGSMRTGTQGFAITGFPWGAFRGRVNRFSNLWTPMRSWLHDLVEGVAPGLEKSDVEPVWQMLRQRFAGTELEVIFGNLDCPDLSQHNLEFAFADIFSSDRIQTYSFRSGLKDLGVWKMKEDGMEAILNNCGGFYASDKFVIAVDRPEFIKRNADGRLDCRDGYAIKFRDGWGIHIWNNVRIPKHFTRRENLTAEMIYRYRNVEVRRVLIEFYGLEKFIRENRCMVLQEDQFGALYGREGFSEDRFLKVINKTPEPDGSFKAYFLFVPPNMRSAKEAVAWTFGLNEWEYKPDKET